MINFYNQLIHSMKPIFPVLATLLLLSGCVSVKIESNRDAQFQKEIKRVFIVAVASRENMELYRTAVFDLKMGFTDRNIQSESCLISELDLGAQKDACVKNIDGFHPDVIMEIGVGAFDRGWRNNAPVYGPNGFSGGGSSYMESTKTLVSLKDFADQKEFWKASVRVSSSVPEMGGPKMAQKILTQLEKDQVIKKKK